MAVVWKNFAYYREINSLPNLTSTKIWQGNVGNRPVEVAMPGGAPDYTAGDILNWSADVEQTHNTGTYTKVKEIRVPKAGTYRVKFLLRAHNDTKDGYARIYKNGIAVGTEQLDETGAFVLYSEDIGDVAAIDLLQLYIHNGTSGEGFPVHVKEFRLYNAEDHAGTVIQD